MNKNITKMDPTGIGYFFKKTVKFFFHFKAELLGMKTRRELKKKCYSNFVWSWSITQKAENVYWTTAKPNKYIYNWRCIVSGSWGNQRKPTKCTNNNSQTTNNLEIRQVDKAIDNTLTMKAARTQYRISHFKPE